MNEQYKDRIDFVRNLEARLRADIFGQDLAVETIVNSIKSNVREHTKGPKATYLFLGPPATGKTLLADLLADHFTEYKIKKFDMTQYHQQNGGELYGYPYGWKGYGVGQLTGFVHRHPKSIIVLDAFEKCDNIIQSNLLSIFDRGTMEDACGWDKVTGAPCNEDEDTVYTFENAVYTVDFSETIFIITSSVGKELYSDHRFYELIKHDRVQAETMILDAIRREEKRDSRSGGTQEAIIPELVSRFSKAHIVMFNKLDYSAFKAIGNKAFRTYAEDFENEYGIRFVYGKSYETFLALQVLRYAPELDARRISDKIGSTFFGCIADFLSKKRPNKKTFKEVQVVLSKEVQTFFSEQLKSKIDSQTIDKFMFRKNMTLRMEETVTARGETIVYKIVSCRLKHVTRIKDYGSDGLVFDIPDISFEDIAGHSWAKRRLHEVIGYVQDPKRLESFATNPPKGMLLYGPPGTGKTMLAKAFAKEADLPFLSVTGVELLHPDKTRRIFAKAREYAPSIIFIDEIDTIGKRDQNGTKQAAINKLLSEMDGFGNRSEEWVFVIAATNYKSNIDPAIIRPGRIEIHVHIDHLDKAAREYFLRRIVDRRPSEGEFNFESLVAATRGFTGAQLELVGKEAAFYCMRHGHKAITQQILSDQINRIRQSSHELTDLSQNDFEKIALYKAASTLIKRLLQPHKRIEYLSLLQTETVLEESEDESAGSHEGVMTQEQYETSICVLLAGKIAQMRRYGSQKGVQTIAAEDLKHAMRLLYKAVAHHGLSDDLPFFNLPGLHQAMREIETFTASSDFFQNDIEKAMKTWLQEIINKTEALVTSHADRIEGLAALLLEKEVLYEDEIEHWCKGHIDG